MASAKLRDITVLLSAAGSPTMPGLLKCFAHNQERAIRTIGMDMAKDCTINQMVDSYYLTPPVTDAGYIDTVLDICKRESVDIYFPNISAEVTEVARRVNDFEKVGVVVSAANLEVAEIANNKLRVYEYLENKGVSVPKYFAVHSIDDFESGCIALGYPEVPVCLKMASNSGSRGVRVINCERNRYEAFSREKPSSIFTSYEEMLSILKEADSLDEMLLVEFMPGNEYTVDLLAENGEVLYIAGRENEVSLMSIAQQSVVAFDEDAYDASKEIVRLFAFDGNIGFDFMRDSEGKARLMDINPRITATVSLIAAAGINLPYLRVKQLLGEELPTCTLNYGARLIRRYGEYYANPDGSPLFLG